jgi:flagellar hook-associated protein FlgK
MDSEPFIAESFVKKIKNFYASLTWISGVFNSVNNYYNYFHYPAAEASAELVWDEIKSAAHAVWSDINGQEPLS